MRGVYVGRAPWVRRAGVQARRLPARAALRLTVTAVDGVALGALLAVQGRVRTPWLLWAAGLLLLLNGVDRRAAARIDPRLVDGITPVLARAGVTLLAVAPFVDLSSRDLAAALAVTVAVLVAGRGLAYTAVRAACRHRLISDRTVVLGSGNVAARLGASMLEHPELGLALLGFVDDEEGATSCVAPLLGRLDSLGDVLAAQHADRLIVAYSSTTESMMVRLIRGCERLPVEMHIVPRFYELGVVVDRAACDDFWGIPLVPLRRSLHRTGPRMVKRCFDVAFTSLAVLVGSPLIVACALAVKLSSRGPVIFRQRRTGADGRAFELYKFRSLQVNDDSDHTWSVTDDARVTRVGALLRRTGLDELPQLFNVLRGDMSLVGPRPERPIFAQRFAEEVPAYSDRYRVRGGMTGWAQIHGLRGDTSIEDRAMFDNFYVEHWSLWRDVVILLTTLGLVLRRFAR